MSRIVPKFLNLNDAITMTEIASPSSPAAGKDKLYFKADGNLYSKNSSGVETFVGGTGISGTNFTSYTPTFVGFGTPSAVNFQWAKIGPNIHIIGTFTSGTATATTASISLPGALISSSLLPTNQVVGNLTTTVNSTGGFSTLVSASSSSFNLGYSNVSGGSGTPALATALAGSGTVCSVEVFFPIDGWTVNSGGITPTPAMRAYGSATSISGTLATINYTTVDFDTSSGYSSGVYTISQAGKYQINAALLITGTIALNNTFIIEIQKNGSVISRSSVYAAGAVTNFSNEISDIIDCAISDTLRIQVSSSAITPSIVSSNFDNYLSISKLN